MKKRLVIAGILMGGVVGFLLRPTVPLMGQLPFTTVISRGANLQGLDQLLVGYARTSFNYLLAGLIFGAVIGLVVSFVMDKSRNARASDNS
jgi:ABC-type nitrate/sulfonate/bicarbonate transport system permease component